MTMCTCDQSPNSEQYYTAFSDIERSAPQEWRTSTRYHEEAEALPEHTPSTPRRILRRHIRHSAPRDTSVRGIPRRPDLITGLAIVPRRIDFDAILDEDNFVDEKDLGFIAETPRSRNAARYPVPEEAAAHRTFRLRRSKPMQHPTPQYAPKMTRIAPCGKCLRM